MFMVGSKGEVVEGIPQDAKLVKYGIDPDGQSVWMTFEHESFPEVPEGTVPLPIFIRTK